MDAETANVTPAPKTMKQPHQPYFHDWGLPLPSIFTCMTFAALSPAIVILVRMAQDPSAGYWLGISIKSVLIVPVIIIVCHLLHLTAIRPRFFPSVFATLCPAIFLVVLGVSCFSVVDKTSTLLLSFDCTTDTNKLELDLAYRSAATIFDTCVQRVASSTNSTAIATAMLIDINDCSEYAAQTPERVRYAEQWNYLQQMEHLSDCSGWCTPGEPALWNMIHYSGDSCSKVAGRAMKGKVTHDCQNLIKLGAVLVLVALMYLRQIDLSMEKYGIDWRPQVDHSLLRASPFLLNVAL